MLADPPAVLDACVLAPFGVCDLFLRLAEAPSLYSPRWTNEILGEVRRTQITRLSWPEHLADYWAKQVSSSFPEALVESYESLISECQNEAGDRHVLAAAIKASSPVVVTFNLKHFRLNALAPYGITACHPADYLCTLYDANDDGVVSRIQDISVKRRLEPIEVLRRLRRPLPRFVEYVTQAQGWTL